MIDCNIQYGAFVPTIPEIYKKAVYDGDSADEKYTETRASDCAIGPRWTDLKLVSVEPYNHDTALFEFELPDPNSLLRLPVTGHLLVKAPCLAYNPNKTSGSEDDNSEQVRPYTAIEENYPGRFKIMVKLYREWGVPESTLKERHKVFLYTKTDHSYKPPGRVSSHIHSLLIGQTLSFKHNSICLGKINYPFDKSISAITMIAVGAGIAPMIRILKALLDGEYGHDQTCPHVEKIHLLYGVRTVSDILQREQLDRWHESKSDRFQVCYCVGSRWTNIHFAAKTAQKQEPPLPKDWETIPSDRKELGWVDGDKVSRRGASNAQDQRHKVFICGLPGVYLSLCGKRTDPALEDDGTQLHRLGYKDDQVIKF